MWLQVAIERRRFNVCFSFGLQSLVTLPLPSRLHCHLNCPYFSVIGGILKLMLSLAVEDVDSSNNVIQTVENCLKSTAETIKNVVEKCDDFLKKREVTEQVVNVIEVSAVSIPIKHHSVLYSHCHRQLFLSE